MIQASSVQEEFSGERLPFANNGDIKELLREYRSRVKGDYDNNPFLRVLSHNTKKGIIEGSNPFAVVLINSLLPFGKRVGTLSDVEKIAKLGKSGLDGKYVDTAIILRGNWDSEYLANNSLLGDIYTQIRGNKPISDLLERALNGVNYQFAIPLNSLDLVNADNSYGLSFRLKDENPVFYGVEEKFIGDKKFLEIGDHTFPCFNYPGYPRFAYTRPDGLSRVCFDRRGNLSTDYGELGESSCRGRVLIVSD